jgi:single-strand DNA-binding protein
MSLNLNKVILGGRLTADVELRQTPQGISVCSFAIAVNRRGKEDQTDFINCNAWRQTAEFISKYFKKGSAICVVGSIQQRSYTDKNNDKKYVYEVNCEEAYFVDSKQDGQASYPTEPAFQTASTPKFEEIDADDTLPF